MIPVMIPEIKIPISVVASFPILLYKKEQDKKIYHFLSCSFLYNVINIEITIFFLQIRSLRSHLR